MKTNKSTKAIKSTPASKPAAKAKAPASKPAALKSKTTAAAKKEGDKLAGAVMKKIEKKHSPKKSAPAKKPAAPAAAIPPATPIASDINPPSKLSAKRTAAANKKAPAAKPPTPPAAKPPTPPAPAPAPAPAAPPAAAAFQPGKLVLMDGTRLANFLRSIDAATGVIRAHGEAQDWTIALDRLTLAPAALAPKAKRYESKTDAGSNYHNCIRSTCEKPIAVVKRICAENPGKPRKEVLALCIAAGVNPSTAATQYSIWKIK